MRNTPFTPAATFAILPHMKTILRFPRTNNIPIRAMLSALDDKFGFSSRYADVGVSTAAEVSELLAFWRPDACVVNNDDLPAKAFAAYPTVFLHRAGKADNPRHAEVSFDEKAVAETAAHHLLSLNLAAYAYVPSDTDEEWSRERERHFVHILSLNGYGVATYIRPQSRLSVPKRLSRLADWIADLPRPVGIFAANDAVAANVTAACNHRHIDIPQDVAIIGVDDNKEMCETSRPTISSIAIDSMAVRTETLLLLEDLVAGKAPVSRHVRIKPLGVVRRASTLRAKKKRPCGSRRLRAYQEGGLQRTEGPRCRGDLPVRTAHGGDTFPRSARALNPRRDTRRAARARQDGSHALTHHAVR